MKVDQSIEFLKETLALEEGESRQLFNTFWEFIGEKIALEGDVEIEGLGRFYLEQDPESKKKRDLLLKFEACDSFRATLGLRREGADNEQKIS